MPGDLDQFVGDQADPEKARLREENERLRKHLGLVEGFAKKVKIPKWLAPVKRARPLQGTLMLQLSDLHLDETVQPDQVNGINAYSREIAMLRFKRWADLACELPDMTPHEIDGIVLIANGDFLSGMIHDELVRTNADCLPPAIMHWAPLIAAHLVQVVEHHQVPMLVDVVTGNHGRMTKKPEAKDRGKNSWDWLLWQVVALALKNDERFTFQFTAGHHSFLEVYGRDIFVTHGDSVTGGGGWSGVWTPLMTIHRRGREFGQVAGKRVTYSVVGHWHQTVRAFERGLVCNGAMKGWDEFAAKHLFQPEPAMQNFWIETPKRGPTVSRPMFLEDRKKEGW